MPINPAIALGVQPLQLADPLAQYGKVAAIRQAQNENALAQYKLGAAQREEAAQNALSQAYQTAYDPTKGTYDINKLRSSLISSGVGAKLPEIEKKLGELRTQQLAQSEAETKLVGAKLTQARAFLDTLDPSDPNAPTQYIAWHEANHKDPVLGPLLAARGVTVDQSRARIAQAIQQGPAAFAQLINQSKLGTEKFMELNAPKTVTQDLGGTARVLSMPGLGGTATVVPGSEATRTLTPGESKESIREVNVGNEVITEAYDPVSKTTRVVSRRPIQLTPEQARVAAQERNVVSNTITDERGNVTLLNKFGEVVQPRDAAGGATALTPQRKPVVSTIDTGSETITQEYDPVSGNTRIISRTPKTLTPEQQRQAAQERNVVSNTVTDAAGNVTLLNKFGQIIQPQNAVGAPAAIRNEQKPVVQNIDSGNEVITQLVNPNTGQITVLGRRPKQMTPEQVRSASQESRTVAGSFTDAAGNVTQYNKFGQVIQSTAPAAAGGGAVQLRGKPSATFEKTEAQRKQLSRDLDTAIFELKDAIKPNGLIDQSTGSGVGRAVDVGARFIGQATKGDIAIGKLKPIADIVLKMVPRFEGPQSDKDTQSYKEAAGQLADPTLPREIRKGAAQTIIRLMENRKGQFVSTDMAAEGTAAGGGVDANNPLLK